MQHAMRMTYNDKRRAGPGAEAAGHKPTGTHPAVLLAPSSTAALVLGTDR